MWLFHLGTECRPVCDLELQKHSLIPHCNTYSKQFKLYAANSFIADATETNQLLPCKDDATTATTLRIKKPAISMRHLEFHD